MNRIIIIAFLLVLGIGFSSMVHAQEDDGIIPPWVKGVANFWVQGNITDDEFLEAIEFLINSGVIEIDTTIDNTVEDEYSDEDHTHESYDDDNYYLDEYEIRYDEEYEIGHDNGYNDGHDNGYNDGYEDRYDDEEEYYEEEYDNNNNNDYPEEFYPDEEIPITQIGDEYWSCYLGYPASTDCLPFDEKYFVGIDDFTYISGYFVTCDESCTLSLDFHEVVDKKLEKFTSEKLHQEIFDAYLSVTPQVILDELVYFSITTDDYYGNESAVTLRDVNNPLKMELSIDPVDAAPDGITIDEQFFKSLMIHENAHMISLSASQSDNDMINPETDAEMITLMDKKQAACNPNYYTDISGCMNDNSYLNLFFQDFWLEVYPDYKWDFEFDTDESFYNYEDKFIEKYEDQFITTYGMSYVEEDFAESFTAFVLLEKPIGNSMVDQKILFFYDFAEIVEMRDFIRSNL